MQLVKFLVGALIVVAGSVVANPVPSADPLSGNSAPIQKRDTPEWNTGAYFVIAGMMLQVIPLQSSKEAQPVPSSQRHHSPSRRATQITLAEESPNPLSTQDKPFDRHESFDSDLRNYYRHKKHPSSDEEWEVLPRPDLRRHDSSETLVDILPTSEKQSTLTRLLSSSRKQRLRITRAFNAQHIHHVTYDHHEHRFLDVPKEWEGHLPEIRGSRLLALALEVRLWIAPQASTISESCNIPSDLTL
ncbi:SubName: Full=Uncharacterized protein {ECO:0000313/EMBL:CCA73709.1} [Serendipita indica DSM 11827]|nr:SubName: Full=Uncharacterized protein {ECO:0000313/EMBL:CCA73709.1} [Serendipita indica DSM 11827]